MTSPAQPKPEKKRDYRQEVTDSIIRMLEEGVAPWQKPWEATGVPQNPTTGKSYRGGNAIHLMASQIRSEFDDPRWMTYRQAAEQGWQVRKGERGAQIEFWEVKAPQAEPEPDKAKPRLVHRVYTVFNAQQIDGIPPYQPRIHTPFETAQAGERILANSGAKISHDQVDRAFYNPRTDSIHLPPREAFKDAPGYYGTALHELSHWSGAKHRLNRATLNDSYRFGDVNYAREELRAELASVFLAAERGIPHDPTSHAAYVGSWIKALREDKNEIFRAAHDASIATDYILSLERDVSKAESLDAARDSVDPEQQKAELENETDTLNREQQDVTEARETTRHAARYEPDSGTILTHDKQHGRDSRTLVDAVPAKDDLQRSFTAARSITDEVLGGGARTRTAMAASGTYRGEIVGETDLHVVQRLSPGTAVAHMKHLLQPVPGIGDNVVVAYSNYKGTVRESHHRALARGLGR